MRETVKVRSEYYAIGSAAPGNDLVPASTCQPDGSYPTYAPACGLYALPPAQVQLDFLSSGIAFSGGVSQNTAPGGNLLATLVFHVMPYGDSNWWNPLHPVFSAARGGILQTQTRASSGDPWTYVSHTPLIIMTPEPASAVLVGLGLAGLGVARRPRERARWASRRDGSHVALAP